MEKTCRGCGEKKPLSEYYPHKEMRDGHLNKCRECTRARVMERERRLRETSLAWVEKERERGREKFRRLGYESKKPDSGRKSIVMRQHHARYPEKRAARNAVEAAARVGKLPSLPSGMERHHWSYAKEHWLDFMVLPPSEHAFLHRHLIYDQTAMLYHTIDGRLLDTRKLHEEFFIEIMVLANNRPTHRNVLQRTTPE